MAAGLLGGFEVKAASAIYPEASQLVQNRADGVLRIPLLPPGPGNPRNSEGAFAKLKDGRLLFIYTHFTGGAGDEAAAYIASRESKDGGKTWSQEDKIVVPNEGRRNVMSVSLLRLKDGKLAMFYLRKESGTDCRPYVRFSTDEAGSWSEPKLCVTDETGYYVLNNDRVIQLSGGRLLMPLALHATVSRPRFDSAARIMCYISDDNGRSWRRGKGVLEPQDSAGKRIIAQEPGLVELRDGQILMFCRTTSGYQYVSYSKDGGESWSAWAPSELASPLSPASIKRIPQTGDLLAVWNNHGPQDPVYNGRRTPLHAAISNDEGKSWKNIKVIEDHPKGWYCYTAIEFVDDNVLLGHCAGRTDLMNGLSHTQITRFPVKWLYE